MLLVWGEVAGHSGLWLVSCLLVPLLGHGDLYLHCSY